MQGADLAVAGDGARADGGGPRHRRWPTGGDAASEAAAPGEDEDGGARGRRGWLRALGFGGAPAGAKMRTAVPREDERTGTAADGGSQADLETTAARVLIRSGDGRGGRRGGVGECLEWWRRRRGKADIGNGSGG